MIATVTKSRIVDVDTLTPIEQHGDRWYKRDDLFEPYDDVPLTGGKVRQAIKLLTARRDEIVERFGGVVLTATGVHSPQGLIIARVARELQLDCVVFVGATDERRARRHRMLQRVLGVGAQLDCTTAVAYEGALAASMQRWRHEHDGAGFPVAFGINLEHDPEAIIDSTAAQCANLPDEIDTVVIAVGAGITAAGIVLGLREHAPQARAVLVQIAGYDRRTTIERIVGWPTDYDWHAPNGIPYARLVRRVIAPGFTLDPIYEAKAWDWMERQRSLDREGVCFWVVGDSTAVRA